MFDERRLGFGVAREIAIAVPGELLLSAGNLPKGEMRWVLRDAAIASIVERDLDFAVRQAALELPGLEQQQWISNITEFWVRRDPAAAFDWARSIDRDVPGTLRNAANRIADYHPELVEPLALCDITPFIAQTCPR
jgi:hypothetical protein